MTSPISSESASSATSPATSPAVSPAISQWECLRKNIGTWHGSFLQFSPEGQPVKATPSRLTLEETKSDQTLELTLQRFPEGEGVKVNRLTFTAPGPAPYVYFFESGTFAQGSAQWSSFGQFGTEISLKVGDRRIRYVIMYGSTPHYTSKIKYVTLICETQTGGTPFATGNLRAEQLLGEWTGTAEVIYATGEPFTTGTSRWVLNEDWGLDCQEQFNDDTKTLSVVKEVDSPLSSENLMPLSATAKNQLNYQIMLLPQGAYCLLPQEIKRESAFQIEVGWINEAGRRTRLIRYYDTRGVWTSSALIEDHEVLNTA